MAITSRRLRKLATSLTTLAASVTIVAACALASCAPSTTGSSTTAPHLYTCDKPSPAVPNTSTFDGLAYGPYHTGQDPNTGSLPSDEEVQADIPTLAALTHHIRIYSSLAPAPTIISAARQAHVCVALGAWLGPNAAANDREVMASVPLASDQAVRELIVGNEVLLRGDLTEDQLAGYLQQAHEKVSAAKLDHPVKITTADTYDQWLQHPALADDVDVITVHIYPFWSQVPIESAIKFVDDAYQQVFAKFHAKYPNKDIVIGETGWPSAGPAQGAAVPSPENQRRYLQEFTAWAQQHSVHYFYFDAFDEGWKQNEAGVGTHWGLMQENGQVKPALHDVVPPSQAQTLHERSFRDVYVGSAVEAPFGVGINTSQQQVQWLTRQDNSLVLAYPQNQQWGALFFTVGAPAPPGQRQSIDLSAYHSLTVDMLGHAGGECLRLGIKGISQPDDGSEITAPVCLTKSWSTITFPLGVFSNVDVTHLYVVLEVVFAGTSGMTVELRNVRYSPAILPLPPTPSPAPSTPSPPTPTPPPALPTPTPTPTPPPTTFAVYTDSGAPGNHYIPSGFMGDYGAITLSQTWTTNPHSGSTCIQVTYTGAATQGNGWAGVYWQDPENNWGTLPGGYDLSRFPHLSFWVRGNAGGEKIEFKVGGITGAYGDSLQPAFSTGVITLTTSWQRVTLDLTGKDLSHIIGGFVWVASKTDNPSGATFYLDDIIYSVS